MYQPVPVLSWVKNYSKKNLSFDFVAGLTLAAYGIPVSLAYATLAGLPPQYGIYGTLIGGFFYTILGTSKQLAIGPTSAISMVIGATIANMANGDVQRWVDIASLSALVFGFLAILAYLLRLSGIVNFISETVLVGFKAGAALIIGLSQLPKLFGINGGGESFFERIFIIGRQIPDLNLMVLLFGITAIIILILGEKFFPGKPTAIFIVVLSIILISTTSLTSLGLTTVGAIPNGFPEFHLPSLSLKDMEGVLPLAIACFLLSYIETITSARTFAQKNGYSINPQQELLALGVTNIVVGLGQGYPVAGGLSQSAVNDKAGAKTPLSLIFASLIITFCLLFLTSYLENLPSVILASIVLVAISGLVDFKEMKHLFIVDKKEFSVAMIALFGVLIFGILNGVLLASIVTLVLLIKETSRPNVATLGRIPGTLRYSDIERHPDNEVIPNVLIVRVEASIFYFNIENIKNNIWSKIKNSKSPVLTVIIDMSPSPSIDISGLRFLRQLYMDLKDQGITLKIAEARSEVRDLLRAEKLDLLFGPISRLDSVDELVIESTKNNI